MVGHVDTADTLRLTGSLTDVLVLTYLQGCTQQRGWREGVERVVLRLEISKYVRQDVSISTCGGLLPPLLAPLTGRARRGKENGCRGTRTYTRQ